eukprot:2450676-Rhodomonas_salina.1
MERCERECLRGGSVGSTNWQRVTEWRQGRGEGGRAGRMYVEVDRGRGREWDRKGGETVHVRETHT